MAISITPRLIMQAAEKRGWKSHVIDEAKLLYWVENPGGKRYYIRGITSTLTSAVNGFIADHKDISGQLVAELGIRVPVALVIGQDLRAAEEFLGEHECIVVKPTNLSHGNGVTIDVTTPEELTAAITYARQFSPHVMVQQQIAGDDYRILMINHRLAAAAIRKPAFVVGTGQHTVSELIKLENQNPKRSEGYNTMLTRIDTAVASRYLSPSQLARVPAAGEEVRVVGTANIGKGGVSIDVTDTIDRQIVDQAKLVVDHLGSKVCGIDFIVTPEGDAYLLEINSGPSLGLHEFPYEGRPRQTPDAFLDALAA